jgi:hypothetical protein
VDYDLWQPMRRKLEQRLRSPGKRAVAKLLRRHADLVAALGRQGHDVDGGYAADGAGGASPDLYVNVWLECTRCGRTAHTDPSGAGLAGELVRGPCPQAEPEVPEHG